MLGPVGPGRWGLRPHTPSSTHYAPRSGPWAPEEQAVHPHTHLGAPTTGHAAALEPPEAAASRPGRPKAQGQPPRDAAGSGPARDPSAPQWLRFRARQPPSWEPRHPGPANPPTLAVNCARPRPPLYPQEQRGVATWRAVRNIK